jgi:hypothetical protein
MAEMCLHCRWHDLQDRIGQFLYDYATHLTGEGMSPDAIEYRLAQHLTDAQAHLVPQVVALHRLLDDEVAI